MDRSDVVPKQVRIHTDPDEGYGDCNDTITDAADAWGCNKTGAILLSCELATFLLDDLEATLDRKNERIDVLEAEIQRLEEALAAGTREPGDSQDAHTAAAGETDDGTEGEFM